MVLQEKLMTKEAQHSLASPMKKAYEQEKIRQCEPLFTHMIQQSQVHMVDI